MNLSIERYPWQARPWRVHYLDRAGSQQSRAFTRRCDAERFASQLILAAFTLDTLSRSAG